MCTRRDRGYFIGQRGRVYTSSVNHSPLLIKRVHCTWTLKHILPVTIVTMSSKWTVASASTMVTASVICETGRTRFNGRGYRVDWWRKCDMCLDWPPNTFLLSAHDVKLFFLSLKNISARPTNSSATMTSAFTQHMSVTAMTTAVTTRTNKTVQVRLIGRLRAINYYLSGNQSIGNICNSIIVYHK